MQTSWTEPDAGAPPPTLDRLVVSVREIRFVPVQAPAALLELAQVLRSLLVNGGVVVETFEVEADEVAAWFLSRNNFDTYGLLEQLLKSEAVTRAAPVLGAFDARAASRTFEQTSSLHLDGDLAGALVLGRGVRRVRGVAHADAKRLGLEVCQPDVRRCLGGRARPPVHRPVVAVVLRRGVGPRLGRHRPARPADDAALPHRHRLRRPLGLLVRASRRVFSVHQTDVITYGDDVVHYLRREFFGLREAPIGSDPDPIWPWSDLTYGAEGADL